MGIYVCIYIVFPYCPWPLPLTVKFPDSISGFGVSLCPMSRVSCLHELPISDMSMRYLLALALPWLCFGPCDPLLCDRSPIPCRDSGFRDSRCHEPLSSQSLDYQSTDAVLCALAHRAKPLAHMTIIRQGHNFVSPHPSGFRTSQCRNVYSRYLDTRYASS